jgi:two-component system, sensor histidine kinase
MSAAHGDPAGRPLRILLLDDEPDDRTLIIRELARAYPELHAEEIPGPAELEGALEAGNFDLVVTDYRLMWTDGLAVLRAVKFRYPDLPVIMFTATGSQEIAVEAMKAGLDDYVIKAAAHYIRLPVAVRSALKQAEDREAIREAERLRGELEAELRQKVADLAEANRRKDEFLAMLSHELRNPLAAITTAAHILTQLPEKDHQATRLSGTIKRQSRHLARLIEDLLDAARITHGQIELRPEWMDLRAVVEGAAEAARLLAQAGGQQLTVSLPSEPLGLHADPARIEQVVANLLHNAVKYTQHGGHIWLFVEVEGDGLRVEGREPASPSTLNPQPSTVTIRVRDTGRGIEPEKLPQIFDPFVQGEQCLARSDGGLGIGLTLVRHLVERHGGQVEAHSAGLGHGSEFTVRLPVRGPGAGGQGLGIGGGAESSPPVWGAMVQRTASGGGSVSSPTPDPRPPTPTRVLVVEDNRDAGETLADILDLWGYDARVATDGAAALELARSYRPDVVLLDIGLPQLDGYEVARRIRQDEGLAGICLVALTGYDRDQDRRQAREAGFDHHLAKPVEPEALRELIGRACGSV